MKNITCVPKPTRPRYVPAENPPPLVLTKRDRQILVAIYRYRILTTPQIQQLFFSSGSSGVISCRRRLHKLFHHKLIQRLKFYVLINTGTRPMVYTLTGSGARIVSQTLVIETVLNWKPQDSKFSQVNLDHLIAINDVRVKVETALQNTHLVLHEWLDERELKRKQKQKMTLKKIPDGYFVIRDTQNRLQYCFFLEVDLGTEAGRSTIAEKIRAYQDYSYTGGYFRDFGTKSLWVLFVVNSKTRLGNLMKGTLNVVTNANIFWFTAIIELENKNILIDPVWYVDREKKKKALIPKADL